MYLQEALNNSLYDNGKSCLQYLLTKANKFRGMQITD